MRGVSISTTVYGPKGKPCLPLDTALRGIAEAGYSTIEFSRKHPGLTAAAPLVESLGLRAWAVHGTLGGGHIFDDEAQRRRSVEQEIVRMRDSAPYSPCPYVIHYTSRSLDPRAAPAFRRSIEELLPAAEDIGLVLAVETVPDKASNPRFPDSKEVAGFARSFGSKSVGVCLDVNHSNIGEDIMDVVANCRGAISTIHVSDNFGEFEDHLPPGEGTMDLPAIMAAIAGAGYQGPLNLEFHTPDYPVRETLVAARQWAEKTLEAI